MAQVAVNKDGTEVIADQLVRCVGMNWRVYPADGYCISIEQCDIWGDPYIADEEGNLDVSIRLPKGSIKKLIGRDLTWEDEPVTL